MKRFLRHKLRPRTERLSDTFFSCSRTGRNKWRHHRVMRKEGDYCGIKSTMHLYDICLDCCVEKYLFEILMKNALKQMHHHYRVAKCRAIFPCTLGKEWDKEWGVKKKKLARMRRMPSPSLFSSLPVCGWGLWGKEEEEEEEESP